MARLPYLLFISTVALTANLSGQAPPAARAGGPPPSPTAADGMAYQVAYVEALPASRQAAVAALTTYRDATRREPGAARVDIFEQIGWNTHFVVVEAWTSLEARETHGAASSTKALRETLMRIAASGYDERPYKTLTVSTPTPSGNSAIYVISHVDTIPTPGADGPGLLRKMAEASRAESGNLRFDVLQHGMRANHFTVVESWVSQAALDAHAAASHTRQYRLDLLPMTGSPLDERILRALD